SPPATALAARLDCFFGLPPRPAHLLLGRHRGSDGVRGDPGPGWRPERTAVPEWCHQHGLSVAEPRCAAEDAALAGTGWLRGCPAGTGCIQAKQLSGVLGRVPRPTVAASRRGTDRAHTPCAVLFRPEFLGVQPPEPPPLGMVQKWPF